MRMKIICVAAFLQVGCGADTSQSTQSEPAAEGTTMEASPSAGEAASSAIPEPEVVTTIDATLPFDMPLMPGARLLSSNDFVTTRRRKEAIAAFVVKANPLEVAAFYNQALIDHGFTPKLASYNDEKLAQVSGTRENGETFSITTSRSGSKAGPGETQSGVVATIPVE